MTSASSFHHRRTAKRIAAAKRKARSELNKCGWEPRGFAHNDRVELRESHLLDTIKRVDASTMSSEEFVERYERPGIPVILTGITDNWAAWEKWNLQRLYYKYRNQKFKCGEDDEGFSVKVKTKYYIDYLLSTDDDSPLYIFDSSFATRPKTNQLLEDYEVPRFFKDDLFSYATEKRRPPYRWFVMGPARSGTGIHIDPLGTSAWNALIVGHKRWCLIHPSTPSQLVKPSRSETGEHRDEAIAWFDTVYRRVTSPAFSEMYPTIHAVQRPGDVMFVPSNWWHVVVNMDTTIAVTQNFCSLVNLPKVWQKTVKGRPMFSKHWLRQLKTQRPEVFETIQEMNRAANLTSYLHGFSSDSSSSSSSSDDSSSSDSDNSGTDLSVRKKPDKIAEAIQSRSSAAGHNGNSSSGDHRRRSDGSTPIGEDVDEPTEPGNRNGSEGIRKRKLEQRCCPDSSACVHKLRRSPAPSPNK